MVTSEPHSRVYIPDCGNALSSHIHLYLSLRRVINSAMKLFIEIAGYNCWKRCGEAVQTLFHY